MTLLDEAQSLGGSGQLFSRKVNDYVAARPDYPAALMQLLQRHVPTPARALDIGAGTGLLTQALLAAGYETLAVEPDAAMRQACDAACGHESRYRSAAGSAEQLPVPDGSVNLITAAQAFHWFDVPRARTECQRVLAPGGWVALIWNDRDRTAPLHRELEQLLNQYGGRLRQAQAAQDEWAEVPAFFGATVPAWTGSHQHALGAEGLASLAFSRSYMPPRDSTEGAAALQALQQLWQRHAQADGLVQVPYVTRAFIGQFR